MKNKLKNNLDKILIYFFVLIQIIFDMLRTTSIVNFEIFGLSILELTNLVLVFLIFLIVLIKNPKHIKVYIIYFIILGIYMCLHYYNTTLFNIDAYKRQTPNFLSESYHILITQGIPLIMLLSIMNTKVSKEDITKLLTYLAFGISIFIVSLNILKLANLGYGSGQIKYTIFDWLTYNNNDYTALTSKGWFSSTNQISAILFMLLPITILLAFKERKGKNYIFYYGIFNIYLYLLNSKRKNGIKEKFTINYYNYFYISFIHSFTTWL